MIISMLYVGIALTYAYIAIYHLRKEAEKPLPRDYNDVACHAATCGFYLGIAATYGLNIVH